MERTVVGAAAAAPAYDAAWWRQRLTLCGIGILFFLPYFVINRVTAGWTAADLTTALDQAVPVWPTWELIYAWVFPCAFLPAVTVRDPGYFQRCFVAFCTSQVIAFVFFLAFPVGIVRPIEAIDIDRGFFEWALALNYTLDEPRNLFPSLHVANAMLTALMVWRADRPAGAAWLVVAAGVAFSTVTLKHHAIVDVVGGAMLAGVTYVWLLKPYPVEEVPREALMLPRRVSLWVIGPYACIAITLYSAWAGGWRPFAWPPVP